MIKIFASGLAGYVGRTETEIRWNSIIFLAEQ